METMKCDMGGAASILAAMKVIALLKPKINVIAAIPSSENMPSGSATKPGDVLPHRGGTTSEVLNTDAEGRLVLADALAYLARRSRSACSGRRDRGDHVDLRLELRDHPHRREDRRRPAHVALHGLHALGVLDRQAAGVEGDALAGERDRHGGRRPCTRARSARGVRSGADAEDAAEPTLLGWLAPDLAAKAELAGHLLRLARDLRRCHVSRWRVHQVARPTDSLGDDLPPLDGLPRGLRVAADRARGAEDGSLYRK